MCNLESRRCQREPCITVNIQSIWNSSFAPFCWLCRNQPSSSFHMSSAAQWRGFRLRPFSPSRKDNLIEKSFRRSVIVGGFIFIFWSYSRAKVKKNQTSIRRHESAAWVRDRGGKTKQNNEMMILFHALPSGQVSEWVRGNFTASVRSESD